MSGPCAKAMIVCVLVTPDGGRITGTNYCGNPQPVCPREPGEDYTKCHTICRQVGHAERVAVMLAGEHAKGARAYLMGHTYACRECQEALFGAGVASLSIGPPPWPPDSASNQTSQGPTGPFSISEPHDDYETGH